jgi:hypothetical protein
MLSLHRYAICVSRTARSRKIKASIPVTDYRSKS